MKPVKIGIGASFGLIALLWLSLHPREQERLALVESNASAVAVDRVVATAGKPKARGAMTVATSDQNSAVDHAIADLSSSAKLSPEVRARLSLLTKTERKVFTSESEKQMRDHALHDEAFLRQIAGVLHSRAADPITENEQSEAIDALLSSQAIGSTVAIELLKSVVTDAQVEDTKLQPDVRENLAEVKAEVMFKWTAADASVKVGDLPLGPVSRRIWANVQDQQARNVAESVSLSK